MLRGVRNVFCLSVLLTMLDETMVDNTPDYGFIEIVAMYIIYICRVLDLGRPRAISFAGSNPYGQRSLVCDSGGSGGRVRSLVLVIWRQWINNRSQSPGIHSAHAVDTPKKAYWHE